MVQDSRRGCGKGGLRLAPPFPPPLDLLKDPLSIPFCPESLPKTRVLAPITAVHTRIAHIRGKRGLAPGPSSRSQCLGKASWAGCLSPFSRAQRDRESLYVGHSFKNLRFSFKSDPPRSDNQHRRGCVSTNSLVPRSRTVESAETAQGGASMPMPDWLLSLEPKPMARQSERTAVRGRIAHIRGKRGLAPGPSSRSQCLGKASWAGCLSPFSERHASVIRYRARWRPAQGIAPGVSRE